MPDITIIAEGLEEVHGIISRLARAPIPQKPLSSVPELNGKLVGARDIAEARHAAVFARIDEEMAPKAQSKREAA